jgi:nicotinate-nucleotide adenylyltransferase
MKQVQPKNQSVTTVGLYFGSFNPVHIGHMAIANYMVEYAGLDEFWFIITPQNPHKQHGNLLNSFDRFDLVQLAVGDDKRFAVSDIEFHLPKPNYTIDTLTWLKERNPSKSFKILLGSDNLENFHKWKNYEKIVEHYGVIVYPRPGFDILKFKNHDNIIVAEGAPLMEISSSFIRKAIREGKDVRYFLPLQVWEYILRKGFYQ